MKCPLLNIVNGKKLILVVKETFQDLSHQFVTGTKNCFQISKGGKKSLWGFIYIFSKNLWKKKIKF